MLIYWKDNFQIEMVIQVWYRQIFMNLSVALMIMKNLLSNFKKKNSSVN